MNFWTLQSKIDFHTAVGQLFALTDKPCSEQIYRGGNQLTEEKHGDYTLSFADELQISDNVAFLAQYEEGVKTVSAATLCEDQDGLSILIASNHTPSQTILEGVREIMGLPAKIPSRGPEDRSAGSAKNRLTTLQRSIAKNSCVPTALQADQVVHPIHIKIHMQYYALTIFVFDPFNKHNHTLPCMRRYQEIIDARIVAAATWKRLESLVYIYYAWHGFEACDPLLMNCLHLVGFAALKNLAGATGPERVSRLATIVLCAKGLRDQADHYYLAEVIFALLRDSLTPTDAQELRQFARIENKERRKCHMLEHVFSDYVLGSTNSHDERKSGRLDELLRIINA